MNPESEESSDKFRARRGPKVATPIVPEMGGHIGFRLRLARLGSHDEISIKEVGKRMGKVGLTNLYRLEQGLVSVTQEYVHEYEDAIGLEVGTTAFNFVDLVTGCGLGDPAVILNRKDRFHTVDPEVKWAGYTLEGKDLDKFISDQAQVIQKSWDEELSLGEGQLKLESYNRIGRVTEPYAMNVVRRAKEMMENGQWEGERVLNQYILGGIMNPVRRINRDYSSMPISYEDLIQEGLATGWRLMDRFDELIGKRNGYSTRVESTTFQKGLNMIRECLDLPKSSSSTLTISIADQPVEILEIDLSQEKVEDEVEFDPILADMFDRLNNSDRINTIISAAKALPARKRKIFFGRYLCGEEDIKAHKLIGAEENISGERVRQIEEDMLIDLRIAVTIVELFDREKDSFILRDRPAGECLHNIQELLDLVSEPKRKQIEVLVGAALQAKLPPDSEKVVFSEYYNSLLSGHPFVKLNW